MACFRSVATIEVRFYPNARASSSISAIGNKAKRAKSEQSQEQTSNADGSNVLALCRYKCCAPLCMCRARRWSLVLDNRRRENMFHPSIALPRSKDNAKLISELKPIIGNRHVLTSPSSTHRFRKGFRFGDGPALAVVRPASLIEQWQALKTCLALGKIVIMQAANTGLTGGSTPDGDQYDREPVGLAGCILDHDDRSSVFDGQLEELILDNITLYWLTNTAVSSARSYWGHSATAKKGFFDVKGAVIPVAVSAFPDEIYTTPRSWAEKAYPKLIYPKGGHFAAWEQPQFYSEEVRTGLRSLHQAT
jgi:hypothetical protein